MYNGISISNYTQLMYDLGIFLRYSVNIYFLFHIFKQHTVHGCNGTHVHINNQHIPFLKLVVTYTNNRYAYS